MKLNDLIAANRAALDTKGVLNVTHRTTGVVKIYFAKDGKIFGETADGLEFTQKNAAVNTPDWELVKKFKVLNPCSYSKGTGKDKKVFISQSVHGSKEAAVDFCNRNEYTFIDLVTTTEVKVAIED